MPRDEPWPNGMHKGTWQELAPIVDAADGPDISVERSAWRRFHRARIRTWSVGLVVWLIQLPMVLLDDVPGGPRPQRAERIRPSVEGAYEAMDGTLALRYLKGRPWEWQREILRSLGARVSGSGAIARGVLELHTGEIRWFPYHRARRLGAHEMVVPSKEIRRTARVKLGRRRVGLTIYLRDGGKLWVAARTKLACP